LLATAPALEAAYLDGSLDALNALRVELLNCVSPTASVDACTAMPDRTMIIRLNTAGTEEAGGDAPHGPWLMVDDALLEMAAAAEECVFVGENTFLGEKIQSAGAARVPGLRIPELTVVSLDKSPTIYFKPAIDAMNLELLSGCIPADIVWAGAFGVETRLLREMLRERPERLSVPAIIARSLADALAVGAPCLSVFSSNSVASTSMADVEHMGGAQMVGAIGRYLARELDHG
jgi:hypothetical protein